MYKIAILCVIFFLVTMGLGAQPVALHPENNHYLIYKNKPLLIVTSAEHYGAVLNKAFNFEKYLETLAFEKMNYTRLFTGSYVEIPGSFNIENNTLAPDIGNFLAPWKRVNEPGLYEGESKFDLNTWNDEYFNRLHQFISKAEQLDIIVEVTLFCSTYQDASWKRHPFNAGNNTNNTPKNIDRKKSNTLDNGNLLQFQKNLVKKVVSELNGYDNVIFEIQNEPWSDDPHKVMRTLRTLDPQVKGGGDWFKWAEMASPASLQWQKEMAKVIVDTENELPNKHLIAQNFTNFQYSVERVENHISIMNFHYAWPEAVWMNYGWNRPVSFDESGFAGMKTDTYLQQAWQFILAGGAIFNNLDYSFSVGFEDGTGKNNAPGAGSAEFRKQLVILRAFIESFDFIKMKPDFTSVIHAPGLQCQCISEPGKQYAAVLTGNPGGVLKLNLPKGKYNYELFSPFTAQTLKKGFFTHKKSGAKSISLPEFDRMVALKIVRQ